MKVKALAQWHGSNRMLAEKVGECLRGCEWVGVAFMGGLCEVPHIKARTIVCNDKHSHIANLCRVVTEDVDGLKERIAEIPFHPDYLWAAQATCNVRERTIKHEDSEGYRLEWAAAYFCCAWMTRSGSAGTPSEFTGKLALRWEAGGGDSNKRFRSAIDSLDEWHRIFVDRCTFSTLDVFEFLDQCKDRSGHGIYCDPPFLIAGQKYTHNAGKGQEEEQWHFRLAQRLAGFTQSRVVVRAYDVPLIREFYRPIDWEFRELTGRKQTNDSAPELLIVRN